MKLKSILGAGILLLSAQVLSAQYNEKAKGQNRVYEIQTLDAVDDETGEVYQVEVKKEVTTDTYGNAAGSQYDLAEDGAFEGNTVAVLHFHTSEGFDFQKPKAALAEKGFSTFRWMNTAPDPEELREKLKDASQLWVISTNVQHLNNAHLEVIREFFESGKGLYIWGDNSPYHSDANFLAQGLFGTSMSGSYMGNTEVKIYGETTEKGGIVPNHLISSGIAQVFEGITIANIVPTQELNPLIYDSQGNLVSVVYEKDGKRAIIDGGFTRLFCNWDTAGTGRYVKNAAAWLVNYERFGEMVYKD